MIDIPVVIVGVHWPMCVGVRDWVAQATASQAVRCRCGTISARKGEISSFHCLVCDPATKDAPQWKTLSASVVMGTHHQRSFFRISPRPPSPPRCVSRGLAQPHPACSPPGLLCPPQTPQCLIMPLSRPTGLVRAPFVSCQPLVRTPIPQNLLPSSLHSGILQGACLPLWSWHLCL